MRRVLDNAREHIFDGIVIDTPARAPLRRRPGGRADLRARRRSSRSRPRRSPTLPEQPSAVADRMRNAGTVRRARRLGRSPARPLGPAVSWVEPVTLAGVHVRLEPAGEEHLADLVAAGADPIVWAHLPWPQPRDRAAMRELLEVERRVALPFAQVEVAERPRGRHHHLPRHRRAQPHARGRRHLARAPVVAHARSTPRPSCSSSATPSRRCARTASRSRPTSATSAPRPRSRASAPSARACCATR